VHSSRFWCRKEDGRRFTYLDPTRFHEYFVADLSAEQAAFMARSQVLNAADNFKALITTPAWRSKPSWMLVATKDRTINPELERWYARRAHSHTVEVAGASRSVYVSHPKEVADVIESAARAVSSSSDSGSRSCQRRISNSIALTKQLIDLVPQRNGRSGSGAIG
jgi:pimeloyl-ACP methyl ester carboxylesterase